MGGKKKTQMDPGYRVKPPGRLGPAGRGRRMGTEILDDTGYDRKKQKQEAGKTIREDIGDSKSGGSRDC